MSPLKIYPLLVLLVVCSLIHLILNRGGLGGAVSYNRYSGIITGVKTIRKSWFHILMAMLLMELLGLLCLKCLGLTLGTKGAPLLYSC